MLTYNDNNFYLNGKKFNIYSGGIHYFRVHPDYWEDRLLKLKALGFNTVETYVSWNLHEPKIGEFDFGGILDIEKFLLLAKKVGLYAIVRPGPYICSEWDFGGLPYWLLKDSDMKIRCYYKPYLEHVKRYYEKLLSILSPLQITNGGNIIAMQIENEYGSYGSDKEYLAYIEKLMKDLGVNVLLFTSDGPEKTMLSGGTLPHILPTANFGGNRIRSFQKLENFRPNIPKVCMEFWLGWFDHWGTIHHRRPSKYVTFELSGMLKNNENFNLYMFHGGTNFGFNSGANFHSKYAPTTTSYDYDAPLNEHGQYTRKYHEIRAMMHKHLELPMGELPAEIGVQHIGVVSLKRVTSLFDNLHTLAKKHYSISPLSMEQLDLANGLILYEHTTTAEYNGKLTLENLGDRAYIFLNNVYKGLIYRNDKKQDLELGSLVVGDKISVLVESMGRINYGYKTGDRKGISQMRLDYHIAHHFDIYTIPLNNLEHTDFSENSNLFPKILEGSFSAKEGLDCFVHFDNFTKGCIFINGFNLGRYWSIGPQKSLYIPAPILKKENKIVIVEYEKMKSNFVNITDKHRLRK